MKKNPKVERIMLFLVWFSVSAILSLPRTSHPAFGIQGDLPIHYHITRSFERSTSEGDLLPRWTGLLDGGRGDALFTFYPPLSYLTSAALIKVFRIGVLDSLKISTLLIFIIAQIAAYLLAREFFTRRVSLAVSAIYVLLPAYPLIALHRGFFANALAMSITPLTLLGAHLLLRGVCQVAMQRPETMKIAVRGGAGCLPAPLLRLHAQVNNARHIFRGEKFARGLFVFSLSISAIILTHAITTYLCGLTIGLMALIYLMPHGRSEVGWRGILRLAVGGAIALAMTVFFLLPQLIEKDWAQIGLQVVQQDYRNYMLFARPSDNSRYRQAWADLNFVTSLITLAQTATALLLGLICRRILKSQDRGNPVRILVMVCVSIAAFGLIISLQISDPLWRFLPGLKFIQFPWRYQPFVSLACALLAGVAIGNFEMIKRGPNSFLAAILTWVLVANCVFTVILVRLKEPGVTRDQVAGWLKSPNNPDNEDKSVTPVISIEEGRRLQNEDDIKYLPYSANQIYFRPPGSDFNLYPPVEKPGGVVIVDDRRARITAGEVGIAHREFTVEAEETTRARIETYHYPNWVARIDGQQVNVGVEREKGPNQGLMTIELPAGRHRLTLDFEINHPGERIARWISAAAWILFAVWGIFALVMRSEERTRNTRNRRKIANPNDAA